jgi:hypothetical protein
MGTQLRTGTSPGQGRDNQEPGMEMPGSAMSRNG